MNKMIAILVSVFCLTASADVKLSADKELVKSRPGVGSNTVKVINYQDIKSKKVKAALDEIDLAFEMGDGYYNVLSSSYYVVYNTKSKIIGFMEAAVMNYTEGSELFLVAAYVNSKGKRIGEVFELNVYNDESDETLEELPEELRPNQ